MKEFLLFEKHVKSSEDCKKFSKSVSYETLVGGTATTGTDIKQTRRLSKGSADKPLSAVGTLTSLLCNSAKVVEKMLQTSRDLKSDNKSEKRGKTEICAGYRFCKTMRFSYENLVDGLLQMSPVLRLVKVLGLVLVLSVGTLSESSAEDIAPTIVGRGNCGASCTYTLDSVGTLTLYGEGDMTDYEWYYNDDNIENYWHDENGRAPGQKYFGAIKSIVFAEGSNITSIGNGAFCTANGLTSITIPDSVTKIGVHSFQTTQSLTELAIPESVTSIGKSAFWGAKNLTSINIPESVTNMGYGVFQDTPMLSEIIIPDTVDTSLWDAQVFYGLSPDTEIVCQGDEEKCKQKLAKYIPTDKGGTCTNYCINKEIQPAQSSEQCNGSYIYENGKCHKRNENQCNDTGDYYYNGTTCLYRPRNRQVVCVNPNYKANDGYCDRLRYTPAEAAKVLRDDNTNSVTITFKK